MAKTTQQENKGIFYYINHEYVAWFALVTVLVGLVCSKFLLSIGSLLLIARAVFNPGFFFDFWKALWREKDFLAVFSIFLLFLVTGLWSENQEYFWSRIRMKLPLAGMPIAFLAFRSLGPKVKDYFLYFFFWLTTGIALGSLLYALGDWNTMVENYGRGQVLATPVHHIRFSLLLVFVMCIGAYFLKKGYKIRWNWERSALIIALVFLFIFLHIFAVRSGLLALYLVLFFFFVKWLVQSKRVFLGLGLALLLGAGAWISYKTIPTLQNKVDYTLYSINKIKNGEDLADLSDSRRWMSLRAGWEIWKENPWFGVGVGDIRDADNAWFAEYYPELSDSGLLPHNQFLFVATAAGIFGLIWFTIAFLFPFVYHQNYKDDLLVAFGIIVFSSFLAEHTIETQIGTAFFIFPLMILLRGKREPYSVSNNSKE
jgi:O-antigen ligase